MLCTYIDCNGNLCANMVNSFVILTDDYKKLEKSEYLYDFVNNYDIKDWFENGYKIEQEINEFYQQTLRKNKLERILNDF